MKNYKLTETDHKGLDFSKDLKILLQKYGFELHSSSDYYSLLVESKHGDYLIDDGNAIFKYDQDDLEYKNIRILNMYNRFSDKSSHKTLVKEKRILVYTDDENKKQNIIDKIIDANHNYINKGNKNIIILGEDTEYVFMNSSDIIRSRRFNGAFIDENISDDEFTEKLFPMLIDCVKDDVRFI